MSIPLIINALWLLCMFAAVTHAAHPTLWRIDVGVLLTAALITLLLTRWLSPQPGWVGLLIILSAVWQLLRPISTRGLSILAGMYAALAAAVFAGQGMPLWLSALMSALPTLTSVYLSNRVARQTFVSVQLRQQALLGLAWTAPCVAAAPSVMAGWQSAQALNQSLNMTIDTANQQGVPTWTWQFVVCALILGLLHGLWVRR